jgi:DNA-binding transcriptional MerR regulator
MARTGHSAHSERMADGDSRSQSDKRYYRIGEVSKITDVKPYVLRYWESEFRWMAPTKSRSNQRLYRRKDIDTILLIKKLLHEQRYTIAGAKKKLRDLGLAKALDRGPELETDLPIDHRTRYRKIREELEAIRAQL